MRPFSLFIAGLASMALLGGLGGCVIDEDIGDAPDTAGVTDGGGTTNGGGTTGGGGSEWTTKASLPTARWGATASALGGKIYVFGGHDGTTVLNRLRKFELSLV